MKLKLVKQGDFLGTKCDFYIDEKNNVYMSRTQIGYALGYSNPSHAILELHQRHKERLDKFSVEVRSSQFETPFNGIGKNKKAFLYKEQGVYVICGYSNKETADRFNDWVADTIISIRKNGYYIATKKDTKWLGIRQEAKQTRKQETDQIKLFVEYAKFQGSRNADRYYVIFSKLINSKLGIESDQRDNLSQETLLDLKALETLVRRRIKKLMDKEVPYKEIYQAVKSLMEEL